MAKTVIIDDIERIFRATENEGYSENLFKNFKKELSILSKYFGLTIKQSYWLSLIYFYDLENDTSCSFKNLKDLVKLSAVELIKQIPLIDEIAEKGYIIKKNQNFKKNKVALPTSSYYAINPLISSAIIYNEPITLKKEEKIESVLDFIEVTNGLLSELKENELDKTLLFLKYNKLKEGSNFKFLDFLKENNLSPQSEFFLFNVIWNALCGSYSTDAESFLNSLFDVTNDKIRFVQSLINKKNELISNDIIEMEEGLFPGDVTYALTSKTKRVLKAEGVQFVGGETYNFNLIKTENIVSKKLILPEKTLISFNEIDYVLKEENYEGLIERLAEKKLPKSLNMLLYGAPGTGKTEMVYQLAKQNNREVIKVNISDIKSKWFGESEKLIKRVFTEYREFSKEKSIKPILLLNEADGVIGKRFANVDNSVAFSLNAMQNIILEEMENFDGILIATTNLEKNFDAAFERRFLYKVQFQKPGKKEQEELWKVKLNCPTIETQINKLVEDFDLTGAQIENVVRRTEIQVALYNKTVNLEMLQSICKEEEFGFLNNDRMIQIGFQK